MKALFLLSFTLFLLTKEEKCECLIVPNQGIGSIEIGKSTLQDVRNEFGSTKKKRVWRKPVEFDFFGNFDFYLQYDSIATFETYRKKGDRQTIMRIIIDSPSICKTKEGIGVNDSYTDVIENLGRPDSYYFNNNETLHMYYDKMELIYNSRDTTTNRVSKVIIF